MPGPHWRQVADVLRSAEAELVAEWKREQEAKAAAEATAAAAKVKRRRRATQPHIDRLPDHRAPRKRAAGGGASTNCHTISPQRSSTLALKPAGGYAWSGKWLMTVRWSWSATSAS